ncbi:MAG: gp90 [uncultured marine phage]|uniref:Gp90 n=1 Tax=uncultured marine phage TaxID=707152 RepID=A0A8D9C8K2_9VIRU|nr:MAG: gp90 [uncultured marine phage]
MPEVQIGSFRRPGIYIREFDNSIIETPTVEGIQNLVIGFAKKGPFNTPVVIESVTDLEAIYGPIDRRLERKGSFFHRTIAKLLESDPVVAINLLITDDALDTLEYQSFSTTTKYLNDVERTGPYKNFFDRSGFWKKDTESFVDLAKTNPNEDQRILHFTNMGERPITAFVFKSTRSGFDVDMIQWYGNPDEIPLFVYPTDYVSDYMVDVLVLSGDWTNYSALAVDSRWGQYFNTSGLRKTEVLNFINDPANTVLSYYQGLSLIPYFRDGNGADIFIENIINRDTDKTGLFCAYDMDRVQGDDFPTGVIDLIGNNLAGSDIEEIDFISYKDVISEQITFNDQFLDTAGNVLSFGDLYKAGTPSLPGLNRTAFNAEGFVWDVTSTSTDISYPSPSPSPGPPVEPSTYDIDIVVGSEGYCIIGGQKILLESGTHTFTIDAANYIDLADGVLYGTPFASVVVIDTTGTIKMINNIVNSDNPIVSATDIVLCYITFDVVNNGSGNFLNNIDITNVTVDSTGFIELANTVDYTVTADGSGNITWEFLNTASTPDTSDYEVYRRIKMFNNLITNLNGPNKDKMTMLIDSNIKASLESMTITDIQSTNSVNKAFTLVTGLDETDLTDILGTGSPVYVGVCFYIVDYEYVLGSDTLITKDEYATATEGVAAKYSSFYEKYRDGNVNTGDFFYSNLTTDDYDVSFEDFSGTDYIVFTNPTTPIGFNTNDRILFPDALINTDVFTIVDPNNQAGAIGYTGSGVYAYEVAENTSPEVLTDVARVWDVNNKHYLRMYLDNSGILRTQFMDQLLQSINPIDLTKNTEITVISQKTNYQQTVEVEVPAGYVPVPNKVLVNGERYTEVKVGDYLLADVDESLLEVGEVPKYITRILSKRLYADDTTLTEITCDAAIKLESFNGDLQTLRFTNVDDYVTTYKGFELNGFRVREDSVPDGTEERQDDILNIVEKGTNMFKALTNKDTIQFRYLVDSFGNGLTELSKQQYVDICGERLDCFGFINMPSMKAFKNSTSPTFLDDEGVLSTEFIKLGGDPESNPAFLYSFGEGPGVSAVGYFAPYVTVNDNGRPLSFPPAAYAANAYLRKFNTTRTNVKPWTIVAGVTNGQITGIANLEKEFTGDDIANLNEMKANPIVTKRNRGWVIETENTAQTFVRSALSFIHVREVLIELEGELSDMLLNFQWQFNTSEVRAEIKLRADLICEKYVNQDGLFNFFNKIDEENNTAEIIDNQIGVLDTYVEPVKGMGIIVNNITILKTGSIDAGGFL